MAKTHAQIAAEARAPYARKVQELIAERDQALHALRDLYENVCRSGTRPNIADRVEAALAIATVTEYLPSHED